MNETKLSESELIKLRGEGRRLREEVATLTQQLKEQNKSMNEFTYIVSHDLQAPLRMVTGFLELLEKRYGDKLDDNASQYIGFAVGGASKMQMQLTGLLEYSRLSTVPAVLEEVDLNRVVEEAKLSLSAVILDTGTLIFADHLPVIRADKKQMVQLFRHLLENAIKFRNAAVPAIEILLTKANEYWHIGIKDNGIGIDKAFAEKIFVMFRKLHTDDDKYKGSGAGLAICKKITELHGGRIWVEAAKGKGSICWFSLPAIA